MNSFKISVVVPVYNAGRYLEQCLNSLLAQTLPDIEIICVNDCSIDNSVEILLRAESLHPAIRVIHSPHSGQGEARNTGVAAATGTFIGFVDADDFIAPTMYEKLYKVCTENSVDCAVCKAFTTNAKNTGTRPLTAWGHLSGRFTQQDILNSDWFNTGCSPVLWDKLFRSEIVKKYPSMSLPRGQDFIAQIDYLQDIESIMIIDDRLYYHRKHPHSVMAQEESIYTIRFDLQAEAVAVDKILTRYAGTPAADFYVAEIVKTWSRRLGNKNLEYIVIDREWTQLWLELNSNFPLLKQHYPQQLEALKESLYG